MRKYIYLAIIEHLKAAGLDIKHFSLWNNNIYYLSKQRGFRTPAVFIEFEPFDWEQQLNQVRTAEITINIHIVTATLATPEVGSKYQQESLEYLNFVEEVSAALTGFSGEGFNAFMLVHSEPDHDHEQILHNIERFKTRITNVTAKKKPGVVTGLTAGIKRGE